MANQTLSTFDAVLKEHYEGPIRDVVNREARGFRMFSDRNRETQGRNFLVPVNVAGSGGSGARRDNATIPAAQSQTYVDSFTRAKYNYGRIEVTGPTIKASRNNIGAFARAIEVEMEGMVKDLIKDLNFQTYNDSSGARARVNETPSGTTVTVDSLYGLTYPVVSGAVHTSFLRPGMTIAFGSARFNPTIRLMNDGAASTVIASVDDANNAIVVGNGGISGGSATVADNDFIFEVGAPTTVAGSAATQYQDHVEMMGLLGIIEDEAGAVGVTNLQGIARATYPRGWSASVIGSYGTSSTNLDLETMQLAFDLANRKGRGMIDCIIGEHSMRREYLKLVQTDKRYVNTMSMDAGFKDDWRENRGKETTLEYNDKPFIFDVDAPYGTIFFVDLSSIESVTQCEVEWADDDGAILNRVQNKDSWEAFVRVYKNFATDAPNKNTVVRGRTFSFS